MIVDPYTAKEIRCDKCKLLMEISGSNDEIYRCKKCGKEFDRVSALEYRIEQLGGVVNIEI